MPLSNRAKLLTTVVASGVFSLGIQSANAATYLFADETMPGVITHANGYDGVGGHFEITVGIDPTSLYFFEMATSVQNVVNTWNDLTPTVGNLQTGLIPSSAFDFESVLLHEMGHALGLEHTNLGAESGESGSNQEYASSEVGANGVFNLDAGADGVIGTSDDLRGDDVNLNYFRIGDNDPFATDLGIVDSTTYSQDLDDLPAGENFATSGGRDVAAEMGYASTEAVMQQGTPAGETQRSLTADDVAGILYAQSGLDELAGTADDYSFTLNFIGGAVDADILIDFDSSVTGFAVSESSGVFINRSHTTITQTSIFFTGDENWFFNDVPNDLPTLQPVPLPAAMWGLVIGLAGLGGLSARQKKQSA